MAQKVKIEGTSYEIDNGRTLIGGTGFDILKGRTLVGGTGFDITFGMALRDVPVESTILLDVDGVETEFIVVHQGNPDSTIYDESCNGTWLLSKDLFSFSTNASYAAPWSSGGRNDYKESDVHRTYCPKFLTRLSENVQDSVKHVKIPYVDGSGSSGKVKHGSEGLSTKIFLLSGVEIGCITDAPNNPIFLDGAKLDYFSYGEGVGDNQKRVAFLNGEDERYFLRTAQKGQSGLTCCVMEDGVTSSMSCDAQGSQSSSSLRAFYRPAMILEGSLRVDPDTYSIIF